MNRRVPNPRILRAILLGCVLTTTAGCNKMLANFSLNQATARINEARENEAERFAEDDLNATQDMINATQNSINAQNFKQARLDGKAAATRAKELVERTKSERTNSLKSEANRWIERLDKNEARTINAMRYQQVLDANDDGLAADQDQDWDEAIAAFMSAVDDSRFLLENLKSEAEAGLEEVETFKEQLIAELAPEHYPEAIIEIDDYRDRIDDLIVDKYDYRTALIMRNQARQTTRDGILRTKEIRSDKLIRNIETLMGTAVDLGAELYAPRTLDAVNRDFDQLLTRFFEQKYDTVLQTGPDLIPRADELILETRRESANTKIEAVQQAITGLDEGQARIYLPGRVEQLEAMLAEARDRFAEEAYSETEQVTVRALEEEQKIIDAFDSLAQGEITEASGRLTVAESVFTRMEDIFAKSSPGPLSPDDQALEDAKGGKREELRSEINNSRFELGAATLKKDDKVFFEAIEIARKVVIDSEAIVQETYHVVAHNSIQELSNELRRYEREGGREYAPEELDEAEAMLLEMRELVQRGEYRQAVERSAETHAQVRVLAQQLQRVAVAKLGEAKTSRQAAIEHGAASREQELLLQADSAIDRADQMLQRESLREAILIAEEAARTAEQAGEAAMYKWAVEEMEASDAMLLRAREAGSEGYAPELLDEAINVRRNAQMLLDSGNSIGAQEAAAQSGVKAAEAFYAEVNRAEDMIADARRFDGFTYEYERLTEAIVSAKYAREFLEQGNYRLARAHARESLTKARAAAIDARQAAFTDRIRVVQDRVENVVDRGPGYFQSRDLSQLMGEIQQLKTEFEPAGFEESAERIELINAQLEGLLATTPDTLRELVDILNDKLSGLENRGGRSLTPGLIERISDHIKFAQLDFRNERFRASYKNVKDAAAILVEAELRLDERDYDRRLSTFFGEFSESVRLFAPVLNIGSPTLVRLVQGPTGRTQALAILNASNPSDFREQIGTVQVKIRLMEPPPTRRDLHAAALEALQVARTAAGGFEKLLILDRYTPEEARRIITSAFLQIRSARSRQQEILSELEYATTETEPRGVRRVIQGRP